MDCTEEMVKILFQHQHGFIVTKIMSTACELGVFDLLLESGGFLSSAEIAERLGTSHMGMKRLLEACVGLKFLRMEWKDNEGVYGNTDLANLCLAKSSPKSQCRYIRFCSEFLYPSSQYLTKAVREGKHQVPFLFDTSEKDIYTNFCSSEERLQLFQNAMGDAWSLYGQEVISAFDLSSFHIVCDLGGGSDAFAKQYVSLYPNSTVTIFDLPEVVDKAKKHSVPSEKYRINFQSGDFLNDPIPEADLYVLARVLHSWGDEKCLALLTKLYKACKPGCGVLIVETILNEDRSGPLPAHIYSILMLLVLEGKERTKSEYNTLLGAAGFKDIQFRKGQVYAAIYGRK
ncbi:acetylserotonin O-methyltransferase [Anolis carolinensis]|uniref:Acetylserotonin O-methyltransferase n=1 Tax=Anolis carolinensis TaxID=28377 RepID=G1KPR1_ANOCA|nr:PREDICTED: acetylserotonin O-methyltransferase [Anolis carolinensis]|eukprot:XP_003216503.1 PREDICTED: acetylserotonin O-methyltransferase [Anolis carolinensis]